MTQKNRWPAGVRLLIALAALAALLACAWFVTSYRIEKQVEKTLREALEKHQLSDRVQWQGISVSPLGHVALKDVVFQQSPDLHYKAEKIRISDIINQQDRLGLRLQLTQWQVVLSEAARKHIPAPFAHIVMLPMDVQGQLDLDFTQDTGRIDYDMQVPNAYAVDYHLEISQIGILRDILKKWLPDLALTTEDPKGRSALGRFLSPWGGLLYSNLTTLDISLHDRGLRASLSDAGKEQGNIISQMTQGGLRVLQQSCAYALPERALSCQHLADFIEGKKSSLRLIAQPEQPVPIWRVMRFNLKENIRLLNLRLE